MPSEAGECVMSLYMQKKMSNKTDLSLCVESQQKIVLFRSKPQFMKGTLASRVIFLVFSNPQVDAQDTRATAAAQTASRNAATNLRRHLLQATCLGLRLATFVQASL